MARVVSMGADKSFVSKIVESPTDFYVTQFEVESGNSVDGRLHSTLQDAKKYGSDGYRIKRRKFIASRHAKRFIVAYTSWSSYGQVRDGDDKHFHIKNRAQLKRAQNGMPLPTSLLDVPVGCNAYADFYVDGGHELVDRKAGLREVAEYNAGDKPTDRKDEWAVLIEMGQNSLPSEVTIDVKDGQIGELSVETTSPVRIVTPTAAECKRYPCSPEVAKMVG